MCIYTIKETDELAISLKEYFQNNPLNKEDYRTDEWVVVPSWNKGISPSLETRAKISAYQKTRLQNGQPKSQRSAARKALTETTKIEVACMNCRKTINLGNYKRWHGENCGVEWTHSEETKQKIGKSLTGKKMPEHLKQILLECNKKRKGKKYPNGYKTKSKV